MNERALSKMALWASLAIAATALSAPASAEAPEVISDKTAAGFKFPESVAYDPNADALYVSEFGSELKPTEKDGKGRIAKVALDGTVEEERFLPADGQTLNKPKGIWVEGDRLWVTDIDSLWVFDTGTKEGKRVALPESQFANDPTVIGDAVYVSDNRGDQLFRVEPADFLNMEGDPDVTPVFSGAGINPNGVYPAADGSLLMVGFQSAEEPRGIYRMEPGGEPQPIAEEIGRLDGVYQMEDGTLLVTEWEAGALGAWDETTGFQELATGFKGPADFAVVPNDQGLLVVVPDLVQSELRLIQLRQ